MDYSSNPSAPPPPSSIPAPRSSAIPRLSRLPVPRSSAVRNPVKAKPSIDNLRTRPTASATTTIPRTRRPLSTASSASTTSASTVQDGTFKKPYVPTATRHAQPKQQKRIVSTGKSEAADSLGNLEGFRSASRASSRADHQSSEELPVPEDSPSTSDPSTPQRKTSRPSLLERTMESIAKIPPSPAYRRRRSSFFNAESPMPSRPGSAIGGRINSDLNEGGSIRALSPTKTLRPKTSRISLAPGSTTATATKRSVSAVPPQGLSRAISPTKSSASKSQKPTQATLGPKTGTGRPFGGSKTVSARMTKPRPALAGLFNEPNSQPDQPAKAKTSLRTSTRRLSEKSSPAPNPAKSSAALREQIRKAKAERKSLTGNQNAQSGTRFGAEFEGTLPEDPFNQNPKDGTSTIRRRVESARTEGRLNISAMELKGFPEEIMKMYDYEYNKQSSDIAWNEVVDLVRFIAADNEIESIPDEAFPDVDPNAFGQDDESKGPQFGGIELLDLHGNLLFDVPIGLRRLERLTTLNLSRNRLMNDSLETIAQIKTLKDLKMADNVLTGELSSAIAELPDLEILELQGNKLSSLPDEVSALSHLRILNVSNNQLSSLPMAELSKTTLVQLLASKNHLSGTLFPDSVSSMARLQILDVSINSISSLTTGSLSFPSLQSLDIAFNRVTMLPEVSSWTSLISILAKDNKIAAIPEGFTSLTSLRSADFTGNDFPRLDPHIALMSGLEKFLIAANPIRERKFLTMSTEELKKDLKARLGLDEAGGGVD